MSEENSSVNHGNITPVGIQEEMKNCYLDYAMSVIVGRALPESSTLRKYAGRVADSKGISIISMGFLKSDAAFWNTSTSLLKALINLLSTGYPNNGK